MTTSDAILGCGCRIGFAGDEWAGYDVWLESPCSAHEAMDEVLSLLERTLAFLGHAPEFPFPLLGDAEQLQYELKEMIERLG